MNNGLEFYKVVSAPYVKLQGVNDMWILWTLVGFLIIGLMADVADII